MDKKGRYEERKRAREAAMSLLYSIEYNRSDIAYQIESFMADKELAEFSAEAKDFILEIANGVVENFGNIDPLIEQHARGWSFNRIAGIDIAVLRLCIYEIFYREDIPANVSINEAVNMAKKYGHDESGTFVNGILGSIYREAVKMGTVKEDKTFKDSKTDAGVNSN